MLKKFITKEDIRRKNGSPDGEPSDVFPGQKIIRSVLLLLAEDIDDKPEQQKEKGSQYDPVNG